MVESSNNFASKVIQAVHNFNSTGETSHLVSILSQTLSELGENADASLKSVGFPSQLNFFNQPQDLQDVECQFLKTLNNTLKSNLDETNITMFEYLNQVKQKQIELQNQIEVLNGQIISVEDTIEKIKKHTNQMLSIQNDEANPEILLIQQRMKDEVLKTLNLQITPYSQKRDSFEKERYFLQQHSQNLFDSVRDIHHLIKNKMSEVSSTSTIGLEEGFVFKIETAAAFYVKHLNYGKGLIFAQDTVGTYYFLNDTNLKLLHKTGPNQPKIRDLCGSVDYLYLAVDGRKVIVLDINTFDNVHQFQFSQEINGLSYDIITQNILGGGNCDASIQFKALPDFELISDTTKACTSELTVIAQRTNYIGGLSQETKRNFFMRNEVVALLENDNGTDRTAWLRINPSRQWFDDRLNKSYCIYNLPQGKRIKQMKSHPHMTKHWNQYVFVITEDDQLHARKVTIESNKRNENLQFMQYQVGVQIIDTFPLNDTGASINSDPHMGLVYLKQGSSDSDNCLIHLRFYDEQQLQNFK